ncbi:MAG TPA: glycosyltransferase family 2 protein [bacterium]|nr:glycosyltransferase family 2 protein [bacterium]
MNKRIAIILINYKDYAHKYLADCLVGIRKQNCFDKIDLYIVDNSSGKESFNFLSNQAPEANIICNLTNDGFAKGNNDAIRVALGKGAEYIVLLNMDISIDSENAISELIRVADSDVNIGVVQSRLMLWPEKDLINSLGNNTHFLGFGYCNNYREKFIDSVNMDNMNIHYPSGAAVLFKSEVLNKIGLFDESYFMYNEDQDLGWRAWLSGYRCVLAKNSVVYHKYEFSRSISKYYYMDRNRIITILKNYSLPTLFLIFPAFLLMELGHIYFSLKSGWFLKKISVWLYFFNPFHVNRIIKERKKIQMSRKIKDFELIDKISGKIFYQEIESSALKIGNYFFEFYFIIIKFVIKMFRF